MGFKPVTSTIMVGLLYQLSYEALLEAGQVQVQFIPIILII